VFEKLDERRFRLSLEKGSSAPAPDAADASTKPDASGSAP